MASAAAALLAEGNSFNPAGFAAAQRQQEQTIGLTAAQAARQQAEIPLVQQQVQHAALENQLVRQSIQDNRTLQQAYANHAGDTDYWKDPSNEADFEQELIKGGISYQGLAGYRTQALKWRQDLQGLDKGRLAIEDDLNQRTTDLLQGFKNVADAQKPQMWAQIYAPALNRLHPGQQFDPNNPLVGDALDGVIGAVSHHKQLLEEAQTVQATQTSAATEEETRARLPGTKAESKIKEAEANALNMDPASIKKMVDGSIDPVKYADQNQRTLNDANNAIHLGLGPKGVQAAIKDGSDRIAARESALAQAAVTSIPFREAALRQQEFQRTQQSYQFHASELDRLAAPITQQLETIQRLNDTLAQHTPAGDTTVAAQLVRMAGGGEGSLAGTEALAKDALGGNHWQALQLALNKWSSDPHHGLLPDEYRGDLQKLIDSISQSSIQRQQILMRSRSALAAASGPEQHRAILADTTNKLGQAITAKPGALPHIAKGDKDSYAALPAGAHYIASDGNEYTKGK